MSCAFKPCDEVKTCALVGGCLRKRFPNQPKAPEQQKLSKTKALNGTKPSRSKQRA